MADTTTTTYGLVKPEVGASADTWGNKINADMDALDDLLDGTTAIQPRITGGSIAGITDLAIADGGTGASTAANARTNLGLGTLATQASNAVAITGGSITGITDLAIADGGTGASTATAARTNLGLGTIATQASSAVAITGGSISGITALAILDGGTGASTAANARTNLGLGTIATQASSAVSITGGSITGITDLAILDGGTGASTAAGALTNLGLTATAAELNILDGVTATTAEINILDGVTATAVEINAIDGVTTTGTALIRAATALAGRAAIDAAVTPTTTAGVGQWVLLQAVSAALSLPAGGTWAYFVLTVNNSTGGVSNYAASVAAGGTVVFAAVSGSTHLGFAWRIA